MGRLTDLRHVGCLALFCAGMPATALADNGTLLISGGLREGACQLEMDSALQQVDMGSIASASLRQPGDRAYPVSFQIRFRDCVRGKGQQQDRDYGTLTWSEQQPVVSLTFLAPANADTPSLFAVSGASGIGLRITDINARTVMPARRSHPVFLTPGNDELTFHVAVERTAAPLVVGAYTATADFRVSYD
ncbi:fimbrial protein [Pseudescherichia vulneris]